MEQRYVVIRSSPSGVWFGEVEAIEGSTVTLRNARRAWRWSGAASCSQLATHGPKGGQICAAVDRVVVFDACEIIDASGAAVKCWQEIAPWLA